MKWRSLALSLVALVATSVGSATMDNLREFQRGSWSEIRRAHAGKPAIVHIWGVTCGPCRVEMPQWGALLRERPDLDLVLIDADLVPNEPGAVAAMLDQAGLGGAENWIFGDGFAERLRYEIDPQWRGEIPRTILIGRDGATSTMEGSVDFGEIRRWLDLQRGPPQGEAAGRP
jgi:thiol-disulfide isomerase/thioredoxin